MIKIKENHQWHCIFLAVELEVFGKKIDSLDASKVIQKNDIPVKIINAKFS